MGMKSNTQINLEEFQRIEHASIMDCDEIITVNLSKLLKQRKDVAKHLLNNQYTSLRDEYQKVYDYLDIKIKLILALT